MNKVIMLTKDNCPKCMALKMFLQMGLKDKYKEDIEIIHKESNEELFEEYVNKYEISSVPVLIKGDFTLTNTTPSYVTQFLTDNVDTLDK